MNYKQIGLGIGAFVAGVVAVTAGAVVAGSLPARDQGEPDKRRRPLTGSGEGTSAAPATTTDNQRAGEGHVPTDLMGDHHPGPDERAPEAFRPDPTAPLEPGFREALTGSPN